WEGGGAPPFWPWVQVLRSLERAAPASLSSTSSEAGIDRLLEPPQGKALLPSSPADRFLVFDAVARHLTSVATHRPVLVVLDDLHAADESSLSLLSFVSSRLRDQPLLIVGTVRDREAGSGSAGALVARVARDALVITPGRLSLQDVT